MTMLNVLEARGTLGQILALGVHTYAIAVSVIYILLIVDGVLKITNVMMCRSSISWEDVKKLIFALAPPIILVILASMARIVSGVEHLPHVNLLILIVEADLASILALDVPANTTKIAPLAKKRTTANGVPILDHVHKWELVPIHLVWFLQDNLAMLTVL